MTRTIYTYFRGGGGVEVGAEKAGYVSLGGVEFDPQIAAVCDLNFPDAPTTIMDVCAVEPGLLLDAAPTWFHASPSCKNASQAKTIEVDDEGNTVRETEQDREAGRAVARFITHWKPPMVTIENVWQYRTFEAFEEIRGALRDSGYSYEYWHLNSADYGVAQTRKRLILVARQGLRFIQRPNPTHRQGGDMFLPSWNGWFKSIEDLIPSLPASQFAAWQLARLPEGLRETIAVGAGGFDGTVVQAKEREPFFTVTANQNQADQLRAFIIGGGNTNKTIIDSKARYGDEPMFTVAGHGGISSRAFLMRDDNSKQEWGKGYRDEAEPAMTIHTESAPRAWLVESKNANQQYGNGMRRDDEPATTVITDHKPSHQPKAWLQHGRVVRMTPRALARFQSLPDGYVLPEKPPLACTVIGNMVCPDLAEAVARSQP